jgi:transposase-like protein
MAPIDLALAEIKSLDSGERVNYTQIAKKHGVDRNTLSRRHRGI